MAKAKHPPSRGAWLRREGEEAVAERHELARELAPHELAALGSYYWEGWARDEQLPPREAWRTWLISAGRGFGKTRAGAEWVRDVARSDGTARIALVGASLAEVRSVMVEGDSGVLAAAPGALAPEYEPSLRKLTWENGATAWLYSAGEPDSLRGPQHSHARWAGAEGVLRQRGPWADRRAPPRRLPGRSGGSACNAGRRRVLASSPPPPRAPGRVRTASSPAARPAPGCSFRPAQGCACSIRRRARSSCIAAAGSGPRRRRNRPVVRLSMQKRGRRSPR